MKKGECYFSRLKSLFWHPKKFLEGASGEKKYSSILFFYVTIAVLAILFNSVLALLRVYMAPGDLPLLMSMGFIVFSAIVSVGFAFASPFIVSAVIHLGVLIFGGKKGYFNTFKPITYSAAISEVYQILIVILGAVVFFTFGDFAIDQVNSLSAGFIIVTLAYFVLLVISLIHVVYTEVVGVSKYQAISKWRSFLAIIFIPVIILIIGIVLFLLVSSSGYLTIP
jgi:hypothetical protein